MKADSILLSIQDMPVLREGKKCIHSPKLMAIEPAGQAGEMQISIELLCQVVSWQKDEQMLGMVFI